MQPILRFICLPVSLALVSAAAAEPAKPAAMNVDPFIKGVEAPKADANGKPPPPSAVFVQEVYALDKDQALAVLEASTSGAGRYEAVLSLERAGKARLATLTALTNRSGDKAVVEAVDIVRYASAYRGPSTAMPKGMVLPTNFESRNAGDTLELEAVLPPGAAAGSLSLDTRHVGLLGFTSCPAWPGDPAPEQPRFAKQALATSTIIAINEPTFLGTFTPIASGDLPKEGTGETWLAFLRVHLLPAPEPDLAPKKAPTRQSLVVEYTVYSLDRRLARDVVNAEPGAEAPWERLQKLAGDKQATFERVVAIASTSGTKSTAQESDEVIYGTQYTPPEYLDAQHPGERIAGATTDVEVRHAGLVFELEPVISPDGALIDLNYQVSDTAYLGNLDAKAAPPQPLFASRKVSASFTGAVGKHVLAATFNPPSPDGVNGRTRDDGRATLLFVRVSPVGPAAAQP